MLVVPGAPRQPRGRCFTPSDPRTFYSSDVCASGVVWLLFTLRLSCVYVPGAARPVTVKATLVTRTLRPQHFQTRRNGKIVW